MNVCEEARNEFRRWRCELTVKDDSVLRVYFGL